MRFDYEGVLDCARDGIDLDDCIVTGHRVQIAVNVVGSTVEGCSAGSFRKKNTSRFIHEAVSPDLRRAAVFGYQQAFSARLDCEVPSSRYGAGQNSVHFGGGVKQIYGVQIRHRVDELAGRIESQIIRFSTDLVQNRD